MLRSLIHYWRINLAVMLGAAVATSVLTGALLVGDSLRGSLRNLTLERLDEIDHALVAANFFRESLTSGLEQQQNFKNKFQEVAPAVLLNTTAVHSNSRARASNVNLIGLDQRFAAFFHLESNDSSAWLHALHRKQTRSAFAPIVINSSLQKELGAEVNDQVLLSFARPTAVPRESVLGRRETSDLVQTVRCQIAAVIADSGVGRFALRPHQTFPFNAFIDLASLQKSLGEIGRVNAIIVSQKSETADDSHDLQALLQNTIVLEDFGLVLHRHENFFSLESRELLLKPQIVAATQQWAKENQVATQPVLTYLANTMSANGKVVPYSTITALPTPVDESFGSLRTFADSAAPSLQSQDILLNEWAGRELPAKAGDTVRVSYYVVGSREQLSAQSSDFILRGIVPLEGLAADAQLTPQYPGIHEAEDMSSWNPPFPVDLNLIRPQDEAYWDRYRATPKAFIALETGERLWQSRFGSLTSIRLASAPGMDLTATMRSFETGLVQRLDPAQAGLIFEPVKQQGLQAASGATDFGSLFLGFSLFLIVAAAILVAMLFRLGVEQRAKEIGTLLAVGYTTSRVRWRVLHEGLVIAGLGCALGLAGAIFYGMLLIKGLATWWAPAIGAPVIQMHLKIGTVLFGFFDALLIIILAILATIRRIGKMRVTALLHGQIAIEVISLPHTTRLFALLFSAISIGLFIAGILQGATSVALFFVSGALLLIAGLAFLSLWFRATHVRSAGILGAGQMLRIASRNGSRNPGRSLMVVALVACASFVLVAVGANRRDFAENGHDKNSGTGGYSLVAETEIPLHQDLNSEEARIELGFGDEAGELLDQAQITAARLLPGEDASCLNLYQPQQPAVLGIPHEFIERGGFQFHSTVDLPANGIFSPWALLEQKLAPGIIPAIGDYNSVRWIMHLDLGKDLILQDELGNEIKLRFVALLQTSIFQSEVLISEQNFLKHFPSRSGYSHFLIDVPTQHTAALSELLEENLSGFGFDAASTTEKLSSFQVVENTYLSVFQTLGGFGLLLGTLGLGIVLVRNVIERRGELATLRAFGFRRSLLSTMLLAENGILTLAGIVLGSVAALIAVAPHLLSGNARVPWLSLLATLFLVLVIGVLASWIAALFSGRMALLEALKEE